MRKKLLGAALAVSLCAGMLAGCGAEDTGKTGPGDTGKNEAGNAGETEGDETDNAGAEGGSGEVTELKMIMISVGFNLEDAQAVEDEINAYIEPKINAKVDIEWMDMIDYQQTLNLKLNSGEVIDILPTFGTMLSQLYSQEALMSLSELLASNGPDIINAVGEDYMKAGEINGELYSIPIIQAFANENCFLYRTDIIEKYNIDLSSVKKMSDLTPILQQLHEAEPELTLIVANNMTEPMLREWAWDGLGDEYGVLMDPMNSMEVTNLFESEKYKEYVTLMREWNQAGYIQKEAAQQTDDLTTIFDSGMAFATVAKNYPGNVEEKFARCAYPFDAIPLDDPVATTNQVTNCVLTIPQSSENPEKAMEFINLLYSDATVQNLMCYGIEGQHYQVVDTEKGIVNFVDGQDMMTCKYVNKFNVGNPFLAYVEITDPDGINDTLMEYNKDAQKSVALGFVYDSTKVSNELTAIQTVVAKYRRALECGASDPETELPKFIEELKAAGIDKVINEKQTQLDEWMKQ